MDFGGLEEFTGVGEFEPGGLGGLREFWEWGLEGWEKFERVRGFLHQETRDRELLRGLVEFGGLEEFARVGKAWAWGGEVGRFEEILPPYCPPPPEFPQLSNPPPPPQTRTHPIPVNSSKPFKFHQSLNTSLTLVP